LMDEVLWEKERKKCLNSADQLWGRSSEMGETKSTGVNVPRRKRKKTV